MSSRLLIVDDSPVMRSFVKRIVSISGFPVSEMLEAANGAEALTKLTERPVDLVLTDINMPVVDGEEFLRQLTAGRCGCSIIVVSTDATRNRIDRLMALGARGYVTKPFLPEALRAVWSASTLGVPCD